jgi:hypothetical protein
MSAAEALRMTAVGVEVRGVDIEAHIPADVLAADRGK